MSLVQRQALGDAIERLHAPNGCFNNTCDICAALRARLYLHAAQRCLSVALLEDGDPKMKYKYRFMRLFSGSLLVGILASILRVQVFHTSPADAISFFAGWTLGSALFAAWRA